MTRGLHSDNGGFLLQDPTARFWQQVDVDPSGGCWLWTGFTDKGYALFWDGTRKIGPHRWAWQLFNGPIPEGLTIDHLCRVRNCVNPAHLEVVTIQENIRRGHGRPKQLAERSQCRRGHPFDEPNTYRMPDGSRRCRKCQAKTARESKRKKREAA